MKPVIPDTFEARGVLIPFENPKLRPVRVRAKAGQRLKEWEAVFENYAGGGGTRQNLIMQWVHLPSWTQMGPRDKTLFDDIGAACEKDGVDPLGLRAIVLQADHKAAEDPEVREIAKRRIDAARMDRFTAYISLLAQATRECGIARGDTFMSRANSAILMQAIQSTPSEISNNAAASLTVKVLGYLSEQAKLGQHEVSARIESVSEILSPIGAINLDSDPGAKQEGYLALSFARLSKFRESIEAYEKTVRDETANRALLVLFAARQFADHIAERLNDIEQKLSFFVAVVRDFDAVSGALKGYTREIAFALDGWSELIDVWDEGQRKFEETKDAYAIDLAVQHILLYLPTMPINAAGAEAGKVWNGIAFQRSKMVRQLTNWIDGSVDAELQARFVKAREAAAKERAAAGKERVA